MVAAKERPRCLNVLVGTRHPRSRSLSQELRLTGAPTKCKGRKRWWKERGKCERFELPLPLPYGTPLEQSPTLMGKWKTRIRSDADTDADADADADTDTDTNQNSFFSPLLCRTEAKHGYSFAKVACLAY